MIVGNMKHIDSVDDSALAGGQGGQQQPKSMVQSGDTLSLSRKPIRRRKRLQRIFAANRPMLNDPDEIFRARYSNSGGSDSFGLVDADECVEALVGCQRFFARRPEVRFGIGLPPTALVQA